MTAGNVAQGVNHRHYHQTKRQSHAHMSDAAGCSIVDDDRTSAGKHENKCPEGLGQARSDQFAFHRLIVATNSWLVKGLKC